MAKRLKQLMQANPAYLGERGFRRRNKPVTHLMFTPVVEGDRISLPVCGRISNDVKRGVRHVTCPECLAVLDKLAQCDDHQAALAVAAKYAPKLKFKPDPRIAAERLGESKQPTIEAQRHTRALNLLKHLGVSSDTELPGMMVGDDEFTFLKNMVELRLITEDGEPGQLKAAELAAGAQPRDSILEGEKDA